MKYRLFLFYNYVKKMYRSPSRMILTLVGLVLSVMILVSSLIFSETYVKSKTSLVDMYLQEAAVEVDGLYKYDMYKEISNISEFANIDIISGRNYSVKKVKYIDYDINIHFSDIRTDKIDIDFINESIEGGLRYKSKLIAGRLIEKEDIEKSANVVVIRDTMAQLVFGCKDPIGEKLVYPIYKLNEEIGIMEVSSYQELEIIGVIKDSKKVTDYLKNGNKEEEMNITIPAYVPLSYVIDKNEDSTDKMRITAFCDKTSYLEKFREITKAVNEDITNNYEVCSYYTLKYDTMNEMQTAKEIIFIIVLLMFLISGISIMNTMFFSVKERIEEIGIRKSIGADNYDIMSQFIFEGLVYGILAAIIGGILCAIINPIIFIILVKKSIWTPNVNLSMSLTVFVFATLVSTAISMIASVIPAIYASKIKIADAIKHD